MDASSACLVVMKGGLVFDGVVRIVFDPEGGLTLSEASPPLKELHQSMTGKAARSIPKADAYITALYPLVNAWSTISRPWASATFPKSEGTRTAVIRA